MGKTTTVDCCFFKTAENDNKQQRTKSKQNLTGERERTATPQPRDRTASIMFDGRRSGLVGVGDELPATGPWLTWPSPTWSLAPSSLENL